MFFNLGDAELVEFLLFRRYMASPRKPENILSVMCQRMNLRLLGRTLPNVLNTSEYSRHVSAVWMAHKK